MYIDGYIQDYDGQGLTIYAPFTNDYILEKQGITECEIRLIDSRHITRKQNKFIHAMIRDISLWTGFMPEYTKEIMKYEFISVKGYDYFSCADLDMTMANEFIEYLIEFCIENGVPTNESFIENAPDIGRYIYMCLAHKKCCICGKKTDLHHVDAVGMGRNRKEITHTGMRALPVCRGHHTEVETIGNEAFFKKYHVFGIVIDEYIGKIYKLKAEVHNENS